MNTIREIPYRVVERDNEDFQNLLNDLGIDNSIYGIIVSRTNSNKSCQVRFIGSSPHPEKYVVSNNLLKKLLNKNIIEPKEDFERI